MDDQKNNKKLSKVLSTKLSIDDYNAFLTLTKLEYQAGLIKEQSTSELLRFTIRHILNQLHNNLIYIILEQGQGQQQNTQNNQQQQQIESKVILPSTTNVTSHQHQVPNIIRRNNLVGQKMTHGNYHHHYYQRKRIIIHSGSTNEICRKSFKIRIRLLCY